VGSKRPRPCFSLPTTYYPLSTLPLLAQTAAANSTLTSVLEFDWPYSAAEWLMFGGLIVAAGFAVWMCWRDTRRLSPFWTVWLTMLRLGLLAGLAAIALNPHTRTQTEAFRPSQVAILVDTSLSMSQPLEVPTQRTAVAPQTRAEAVQKLLRESPLIAELRKQHNVDLYRFDSDLSPSLHRFSADSERNATAPPATPDGSAPSAKPPEAVPDYAAVLAPQGAETRLGDAVDKALAELKGNTLSGVLVISDGAANSGRDVRVASERAKKSGARIVAVGVGATLPPMNIELVRVVAPTDVQKGDSFEIAAFIQSQGMAGQSAQVELLQKSGDEKESSVVDTKSVNLSEDGRPVELKFDRVPPGAGNYEYTVRVKPQGTVIESREDDNTQSRPINIYDRPMKILLIAGGPMRDYRFVRNLLHRHPSMDVDVWLQSGDVGISQDSDNLLFKFPPTREELFAYDVILAFDPDWKLISPEQQKLLEEWVAQEGGGLVFIAGDIYTEQLANDSPEVATIRRLCPVLVDQPGPAIRGDAAAQAWPVSLTQEGQAAEFLRLSDDVTLASKLWQQFPGFYKCFPTKGRKGGTTVYAEFSDPLSRGRDGQPVLIAAQRFSQGQSLYIGSAEFYRLRSYGDELYDRFWIKLTRKAAEGRSKRGVQRGMLILEGREYDLGQVVPVRARVVNAQFQPLETETINLEAYDPQGKPLTPVPVLTKDPTRPQEFKGDFRVLLPGKYKIGVAVPDEKEPVTAELQVRLPQLEFAKLIQDVPTMESLVSGAGGKYLTLKEAADVAPSLFPNKGERIVIDQRIKELWDRSWVLYLLIGLLGVEWLTRKLLRLA
jgi:nucleotide-binding universal stress UspA family protein